MIELLRYLKTRQTRQTRFGSLAFLATILCSILGLVPFSTPMAEAARNQQDALDLTILERQGELTLQMDPAQRLQLLRIEEAIREARSDLRSARFMIEAKPSTMQPDRDVKAIQAEGTQIAAQAEASLYENQKALVELLNAVDEGTRGNRPTDQTVFAVELETLGYAEALELACRKIMDASWEKGYEALFFHEVFMHTPDGLRAGGSALRNAAYDTLVAIDGMNFTLTLPVNFKLKAETAGDEVSGFEFENSDAFERRKKALLAIEFIAPEKSSSGLLSVRAIDMATHRIVAVELIKINDLSNLNEEAAAEALPDRALQRAELLGGAQNMQQASSLAEPYRFQLQSDVENRSAEAFITQLIFENSGLLLVDSPFIKAAYGAALDAPETWKGMANGQILLSPNDTENSFELDLMVFASEQTLPAGTLTLGSEPSE